MPSQRLLSLLRQRHFTFTSLPTSNTKIAFAKYSAIQQIYHRTFAERTPEMSNLAQRIEELERTVQEQVKRNDEQEKLLQDQAAKIKKLEETIKNRNPTTTRSKPTTENCSKASGASLRTNPSRAKMQTARKTMKIGRAHV